MALTGLQIFKLLPNTNCKKCGYPTCLAFAMKLAAGKEALDKCPSRRHRQRAARDHCG
jgi:acetyl-CoA decarbonylase/synthase complex subunit gamma